MKKKKDEFLEDEKWLFLLIQKMFMRYFFVFPWSPVLNIVMSIDKYYYSKKYTLKLKVMRYFFFPWSPVLNIVMT